MAPIAGLNNLLSPRGVKKYEPDMAREWFVTKVILGFIVAIFAIIFGYCIWKTLRPKYEEKWRPKLKSKLQDCGERYEGCKKKLGAWHGPKEPNAPAPAHVVDPHAPRIPEINRITTELTPDYLKMTTAVMFPID